MATNYALPTEFVLPTYRWCVELCCKHVPAGARLGSPTPRTTPRMPLHNLDTINLCDESQPREPYSTHNFFNVTGMCTLLRLIHENPDLVFPKVHEAVKSLVIALLCLDCI